MEAVKIELTLNGDVMNTLLEMLADKVADKLAAKKADKEENEEESNKEEVKEEIPIRINTSNNTTNTNNKNKDIIISNNACMHNALNNITNNTNAEDLNTNNKDLNALDTNAIDSNTNAEVTMDQILAYMSQKGYKFDPNKFYSYYRGMGWKTKNGRDIRPIWKETIDQWAKYEYNRSSAKAATTPNKVGMGTREERMAAHPFVPTDFNEFAPV